MPVGPFLWLRMLKSMCGGVLPFTWGRMEEEEGLILNEGPPILLLLPFTEVDVWGLPEKLRTSLVLSFPPSLFHSAGLLTRQARLG